MAAIAQHKTKTELSAEQRERVLSYILAIISRQLRQDQDETTKAYLVESLWLRFVIAYDGRAGYAKTQDDDINWAMSKI